MTASAYLGLAGGSQDRFGSYRIMRRLVKEPGGNHLRALKGARDAVVREACRAGNPQLVHLILQHLSVGAADLSSSHNGDLVPLIRLLDKQLLTQTHNFRDLKP